MYTFRKEERLCNKKLIEQLFRGGSSFLCYPFKVSFLIAGPTQSALAQVVFPIGKKRFKRAVDRNLIRRRTREAYRLHKQQCLYNYLDEANIRLAISLGYVGKEILPYEVIEKKLLKVFTQISQQLSNEQLTQDS